MKILITSNSSWNLINFRKELLNRLIKYTKNQVLIVSKYDKYSKNLKRLGCNFINLDIKPRNVSFFGEFIILIKYYLIIKKVNPDLVLSFTIKPNIYSSLVCNFLKIKNICNITGLGYGFENIVLKNLIIFLSKFTIKKSTYIFFQNKKDLRYFREKKILNKRYKILPGSGIKIINAKKFFKKTNSNTFLYVGRIIPDKGIRELVDAFCYLINKNPNKEIKLKLVGAQKGDLSKEILKKKIKQIEIINFTTSIKKYFLKSDYFVFPSYREGMSRSLLQAGIFKLPIICSNVPGNNDLIENKKNGFLFKSKSVKSLYECMEKIIYSDKKELELMSNKLFDNIKNNFDERIVVKSYIDAIERINEY